jgi:type I restriction enzyme S subunit
LGDLFDVLDGTHDGVQTRGTSDVEFCVPFLRSQDIGTGSLRRWDGAFLTESDHLHKCKRSQIKRGDVLLNIMATTGEACLYSDGCPDRANANRAVGILRAKSDSLTDSFKRTLCILLSSKVGNRELARNLKGSIQQRLNLEDIAECNIPILDPSVQQYIGDKVRQAEELRQKAEKRQFQINSILNQDLIQQAMATPNDRTNRVRSGLLEPRLDAKFYSPRSMRIFEATFACDGVRLGNLNPEISNGFEHRTFVEQGRAYLTVTQVGSRRLDLGGVPRIPESVPVPERARLTERTVLAVRSGATIGTVVKAQPEDCHACVSSHFIILRFSTESVATAVATFLNSDVGRSLQDKIVYGGVIPQISQDDLLSLPIPQAVLDAADQLASWENAKEQALRCAQRLVAAAKFLVEALIDGRLSEREMITVQHALESGDQTLDRTILSRLTEDGIDVVAKPRLFADLDALYVAIDEARRTQPSNGDAA